MTADATSGDDAPGRRLDEVFRSARPSLVHLVSRVLDAGEAEDVVQDAFLRLEGHQVLHRPEPEVVAWLRRVALNLAFNRARDLGRWKDRAIRGGQFTHEPVDPAAEAIRSDERDSVRKVLNQLPDKQRNCLLLRHTGYSYAEIAATLGIPAASVGTTLARAERAFKTRYLHETQTVREEKP